MQVLRHGMSGEAVERWQHFLIGRGADIEADGDFGDATLRATKDFQARNGLGTDGVVGRETLSVAMRLGFGEVEDDDTSEESPTWPPKPDFSPLVSTADRERIFGKFAYKATPSAANPEGITITDGWASTNIVMVEVPQLKGINGAPGSCKVPFHRLGADQLKAMWQAWEDDGLLPLVLGWAGSWVPRFVRGSRTHLSNHAFGTAFDINVPWNMLGAQPALVGKKGSVRKLVPIANAHGFYWGGHFGYGGGRADGMHFELAEVR